MATYIPPRVQTNECCVVCGAPDRLDRALVNASSIPPWFWFLLPVAPIPALLLASRYEICHRIEMSMCHACRRRQTVATAVYFCTFAFCVATVMAAVAIGIANNSWLQFTALSALAGVAVTAGSLLKRRAAPRYTTLTQQRVEIEVPGRGRVVVFPT